MSFTVWPKLETAAPFIFRPATVDDCELLLDWRNDRATIAASMNGHYVSREEHTSWLTRTLFDNRTTLLIAEKDGVPVGTVRSVLKGCDVELSWTVAPQARGAGLGKQMVKMRADNIAQPLKAEVKSENSASAIVAEFAGLLLYSESNGIKTYRRPAITAVE